MNHKITFQELVEAVSEQTGRSKQFSHDFIKDFASLIKDGLEENGSVNVAGLGTFKLKKMDEREGYNPETEEKITIPPHNKIDFTPYKDLSELVNAPYTHMEPEILEEEVQSSPSSESEEIAGEESEEQNEEVTDAEHGEKEIKKAPWEKDMESEIEVDKDDPFGLNAKHQKGPVLSEGDEDTGDEEQEEDVVEFNKETSRDSESNQEAGSEEIEEKRQEPQEEEPVAASAGTSKNVTSKPHFRDRSHRRKGAGGTFWIIAAAFIILLLAIGAWYFLGTQQQATPPSAVSETSQVQDQAQTPDQQQVQAPAQPQEQEQQEDTEPAQQQEADDHQASQQAADQADSNNQQAAAQNSQGADPSTAAPVETITVAAGQTLWGLADNAYQNPYLWPWIYDTNQPEIEDPDLIYAGQMLDIPQKRGQNNQLSNNDSLQVALGYVETYLWYKENNLENARFYLYAAKKYHNRVFEYTDATFDEEDLRFANRAQ